MGNSQLDESIYQSNTDLKANPKPKFVAYRLIFSQLTVAQLLFVQSSVAQLACLPDDSTPVY